MLYFIKKVSGIRIASVRINENKNDGKKFMSTQKKAALIFFD